MLNLKAKTRDEKKKREEGILPGVVYGKKLKSQSIEVDSKVFEKVLGEAGETSLISLKLDDKEFTVLIHALQKDPITGNIIHVDFFQPILTEKTEAHIPLVFEGESIAVKDLGGTLIKELQEISVKALPQDLPHEVIVDISVLEELGSEIFVRDLKVSEKVEITKDPDELVAKVTAQVEIEEETEKPEEAEEAEVEGEKKEGEEESKEEESKE